MRAHLTQRSCPASRRFERTAREEPCTGWIRPASRRDRGSQNCTRGQSLRRNLTKISPNVPKAVEDCPKSAQKWASNRTREGELDDLPGRCAAEAPGDGLTVRQGVRTRGDAVGHRAAVLQVVRPSGTRRDGVRGRRREARRGISASELAAEGVGACSTLPDHRALRVVASPLAALAPLHRRILAPRRVVGSRHSGWRWSRIARRR